MQGLLLERNPNRVLDEIHEHFSSPLKQFVGVMIGLLDVKSLVEHDGEG